MSRGGGSEKEGENLSTGFQCLQVIGKSCLDSQQYVFRSSDTFLHTAPIKLETITVIDSHV